MPNDLVLHGVFTISMCFFCAPIEKLLKLLANGKKKKKKKKRWLFMIFRDWIY